MDVEADATPDFRTEQFVLSYHTVEPSVFKDGKSFLCGALDWRGLGSVQGSQHSFRMGSS